MPVSEKNIEHNQEKRRKKPKLIISDINNFIKILISNSDKSILLRPKI